MSDERERQLIADAREWSRIVASQDPAQWLKGYVEDGLHHVDMLADALEAALASARGEREAKLEDDIENLKQQVIRAEENARQWEGNEIAQHERVKELEREVASSEDSQDATHRLRDEGFELWRYR